MSTENWLQRTLSNLEWEGQKIYLGKITNIQFLEIFAIVFKSSKLLAFCFYVSLAYPV